MVDNGLDCLFSEGNVGHCQIGQGRATLPHDSLDRLYACARGQVKCPPAIRSAPDQIQDTTCGDPVAAAQFDVRKTRKSRKVQESFVGDLGAVRELDGLEAFATRA